MFDSVKFAFLLEPFVERDLHYVLKYSLTMSLGLMFTFITIFNVLTLVQTQDIPMVLYFSILNNIVGIIALVPVYMHEEWAWKSVSAWIVFYIAFLLYNAFSGWVVNATGYLMFFFGIALALTLKIGQD